MASLESAAVESLDRDELRKSCNSNDSSLYGIPGTSTIRVTVVQSGRRSKFNIVERTAWKGGAWNEHDSTRDDLTMTGTGVSGILRFKSEGSNPEFFLVALGLDKSRTSRSGSNTLPIRWCDLKVNARPNDVAVLLHPQYYTPRTQEYQRKKRHQGKVHYHTKSHTHITVEYYFDEDLLVKEPWACDEGVKEPRVFEEGVTEPRDFDEGVQEPRDFDEDVKEPGLFEEGVTEPRGIDFVRLRAVKITIT